MRRSNKKARVETPMPPPPTGVIMAVTRAGRGDPQRGQWMALVVRVDHGARVNYSSVKCDASACVAAVLSDPMRRMTGLGGREGVPLSFASVYAGAVTRFLRRKHRIAVLPDAAGPCAPHVDGEEYGSLFEGPYPPALGAVGGGVYALLNKRASVEAGSLAAAAAAGAVAVEVRCVTTHAVLARMDLHALQLGRVFQLALYDGALAAGAGAGAGAGASYVTLLLAGSQPTAGEGRVVAVQLQKRQDGAGPWPYVVHGPLDHTRATLAGVAVVQPQGPDGALLAPVIVAATQTGYVVVFPGLRSRGVTVGTTLGAPAAMCSMLEPGSGRLGARFAVVETSGSCVSICRVAVGAEGRFSVCKVWSSAPGLLCSPSHVTCTGAGELLVCDMQPRDDASPRWWHRSKLTRVFPPCDGGGGGAGPCQELSPTMRGHGVIVACRNALLCIKSRGVRTMYVLQ
jgi:hypothetical protein